MVIVEAIGIVLLIAIIFGLTGGEDSDDYYTRQ